MAWGGWRILGRVAMLFLVHIHTAIFGVGGGGLAADISHAMLAVPLLEVGSVRKARRCAA